MNNKILILVIVHCQFSRTEDRNIKITASQADTWELHNSLGARSTILSNGYACQTEACIHATALIRASPRCFLGSCSRPIMHQSELLLHRENLSDVLQRSSAVRSLDRQITWMEQLLLLEYYIPFIIGAYILVDALDDAYRVNDLYAIFHKNYRNMFAQTGYQRFSLVSFIVCAQRGLSIIGQNLEEDWNGMGFSVEMFGCLGCSRRLLWTVL